MATMRLLTKEQKLASSKKRAATIAKKKKAVELEKKKQRQIKKRRENLDLDLLALLDAKEVTFEQMQQKSKTRVNAWLRQGYVNSSGQVLWLGRRHYLMKARLEKQVEVMGWNFEEIKNCPSVGHAEKYCADLLQLRGYKVTRCEGAALRLLLLALFATNALAVYEANWWTDPEKTEVAPFNPAEAWQGDPRFDLYLSIMSDAAKASAVEKRQLANKNRRTAFYSTRLIWDQDIKNNVSERSFVGVEKACSWIDDSMEDPIIRSGLHFVDVNTVKAIATQLTVHDAVNLGRFYFDISRGTIGYADVMALSETGELWFWEVKTTDTLSVHQLEVLHGLGKLGFRVGVMRVPMKRPDSKAAFSGFGALDYIRMHGHRLSKEQREEFHSM